MLSHRMKRIISQRTSQVPEIEDIDSNFKQTTLLLHGDGAIGGQNNTFVDSSVNNFAINRFGNPTQGTFSPFSLTDGYWSNYFDGVGDYLQLNDSTSISLGSSNFTMECWIYTSDVTTTRFLASKWSNSGGPWQFYITGSKVCGTITTNAGQFDVVSNALLIANQWNHVAWVRNGTSMYTYVNGVQSTPTNISTNSIISRNDLVQIAHRTFAGGVAFIGHISNFRIVNSAIYTSAFTPPTAPLTTITNTSLLTCQSNRFKDNSSNAFTITRNGDTAVTIFSPFASTAAYLASTNGGSGYFDGAGDFLTAPYSTAFNFGTDDFTIEMWIYPIALSNIPMFFCRGSSQTWFFQTSTTTLYWGSLSVGYTTWAVSLNTHCWTHVALTRSGSTLEVFINGISQTAKTVPGAQNSSDNLNPVYIGNFGGSSYEYNGYISDYRIVKGSRVYTSSFTPPSSPLSAITNTSLLLNFINGAIVDSAAKNNIETSGNSRISNSQIKFGTGSIFFDGTGDYISIPSTPNLALGSDNFTIECWLYKLVNKDQCIWDTRLNGTSPTGIALYITSGNVWTVVVNNSPIGLGTGGSNSTWMHVALVKNGRDIKLYVNGISISSTINVSSTFNLTDNKFVIGTLGHTMDTGSSYKFNGFIDEFRVTKGIARYTANFTVPTKAFPNR